MLKLEQWRAVMALCSQSWCADGSCQGSWTVWAMKDSQGMACSSSFSSGKAEEHLMWVQHCLYRRAPPWVAGEAPGQTKAQIS